MFKAGVRVFRKEYEPQAIPIGTQGIIKKINDRVISIEWDYPFGFCSYTTVSLLANPSIFISLIAHPPKLSKYWKRR